MNTPITLPDLKAFVFEGYGEECEMKAFGKMKVWLQEHHPQRSGYRIFGYNTDSEGNLTISPDHPGYKVLLVMEDRDTQRPGKQELIPAGKFLVIRTEGMLENVMQWLPAGWMKMNGEISEKKYNVKVPTRWYEEHITTSVENYMIVDLYLEVE